jgi:hypothetical protein
MKFNGSRTERMYELDKYTFWKLKDRSCHLGEGQCIRSLVFRLTQLVYSKRVTNHTNYYHAECAVSVGAISKEDYFKHRELILA